MSKGRKPRFDTVDEDDMGTVARPKRKPKREEKHAVFSDSEAEQEPEHGEIEEKAPRRRAAVVEYEDEKQPAPARRGRPKKTYEPPEESEEPQYAHPCSGCQERFDCNDGQGKKIRGKLKVKCSCVKVKVEGGTAYFCSKKCKKEAEEQNDDDEGYDTA